MNSPGGDLFAGLSLGRALAAGDYQTIVNIGDECASACALAFLGGRSRLVLAKPDAFGFHRQYYIKDGEIQYGSWNKDLATIQTYLSAINFTGLKADEIIGTTGLATYSDNRLSDRSIVTITRRAHRQRIESTLKSTGASATEKYMASCMLLSKQFDCGTVVFPFRLPMLIAYFMEEPKELLDLDTMAALRPRFRAAKQKRDFLELNCRLMGAEYIDWLNARLENLTNLSPPAAILESYRESISGELARCAQLLQPPKQN